MFIPYLLIIITLSTQLYSMKNEHEWALYKEIRKSPHTQLIPFSCNPDVIGNSINFAEKSGDGNTMAKLLYLCLPKEVIAKYITPHLAKYITTQYKHNVINNNCYASTFEKKTIPYTRLRYCYHHDGTYKMVPSIGCKYALWNAAIPQKCYHMYNNVKLISLRRSADLNLYAPVGQDKHFYLFRKNNDDRLEADSKIPISHYIFSNDKTFILFGSSQDTKEPSIIYDITQSKCSRFSIYGSMSASCSAHHSPTFVIGIYEKAFTKNKFFLIKKEHSNFSKTPLTTHIGTKTYTEFSPDDSRLLICTQWEENDSSILQLWNTSNLDSIDLIKTCYNYTQKEAFFACDGERIILTHKNGHFSILNGLTGELIKENNQYCIEPKLIICSNKNKLIITAINNTIRFFSSETGEWLGDTVKNWDEIEGIGLTDDEQSIIITQKNIHFICQQLQLYNKKECDICDFIDTKANIIQLYEILDTCEQNKDSTYFIEKVKAYI